LKAEIKTILTNGNLPLLLRKFIALANIVKDVVVAKAALEAGELVAIPTETVYGLAANGTSPSALKKIFEAKGRPINNPLILHFKDTESLAPFVAKMRDDIKVLASHFWPGPLTLLLPKSEKVPEIVTAGSNQVAVRVPKHPVTLALLQLLDFPLAAPSANPSGYISPTQPEHVEKQLGEKIQWILDGGPCHSGIESTILGWENDFPIIYRKGVITAEQIGEVLGKIPEFKKTTDVLEAPGMSSSHYAPNTKTLVVHEVKDAVSKYAGKKIGLIVFAEKTGLSVKKEIVLSPKASLHEMAQKLYASMHQLDEMGLDLIIIEKAPEEGIGKAINDRLQRSAFKSGQ
jgi:L-threonylcarbamoyladenylate synthase